MKKIFSAEKKNLKKTLDDESVLCDDVLVMKTTTTTKSKLARRAYIGTFVKVDGSIRTMKFMATEKQAASTKRTLVWDMEKNALRSFNFSTLVGRLLSA